MKNYILNYILEQEALTIDQILLNLIICIIISAVIYIAYRFTYSGVAYSGKFNISLVMLTVITTIVMTVISNNISLSLGMVGALSIIRFRTAIKDPRDAVFIFWTIAVGICCGTAQYLIAAIGSVVTLVVLLLFGQIHNDSRYLVIVRCDRSVGAQVESTLFIYFGKLTMRVKNTTTEEIEYIYEVSERIIKKAKREKKDIDITEKLYAIQGVQLVNIVSQSDDITV